MLPHSGSILQGRHSPGQHRTNGLLRNIPEFYATFDVDPGNKMYLPPAQRVKIWGSSLFHVGSEG